MCLIILRHTPNNETIITYTMSEASKEKKIKFLEPTINFSRKRVLVGEPETAEKLILSELVRKDQDLLSFPDFKKFADKGYEKSPVRSGTNTHYSEDGETLLASIVGYPRIDIIDAAEGEEPTLLITVKPLVEVSRNKMNATLRLQPPIPDGFTIQESNLSELIKEAGILFGINEQALQDSINLVKEGFNDFHEIPLAEGMSSEIGVDASLEFAITVGPIPGLVQEDGTIDFRERGIMTAVRKGDLLATVIPEIPGASGTNVLGEDVEPEGGQELKIKVKNDVGYDEETGEIVATNDGIFSIVNNSEINVSSKYEVKGDVDYTTGHIDSGNCVIVQGAVQPGFKVTTGGDLQIKQEVMSGIISSLGNVLVSGGITGEKTEITAAGDVDIKFIEQGKIQSGGNVIIRKQSYYSTIDAAGDIRCPAGTNIVGGSLVAGGMVTVANVGSESSKSVLLAAGVDFERLRLMFELKETLSEQQDEIIQRLQRHGGSARSKKIRKMEAAVDETKLKILKLNLIPGTALFSRVGELKGMLEGSDENDTIRPTNIETISIAVHGTIHRGTQLRIGNAKLVLQKTISNRRLKLKSNLKQIIAVPLAGKA